MVPEYVSKAAIQIYSMDFAMKCSIVEKNGAEVTVLLSWGKCDMIRKYDPVVFLYMDREELQSVSAIVLEADYESCNIKLLISEKYESDERRIFERFPVSLEASARKKFQNKRINLVVKNLSVYGLGIQSDMDIDVDEIIDIDLITKKNMLYFSAKISWKKLIGDAENNFEYGLHITGVDVATVNILEEYLQKLQLMYLEMYNKAK